MTRPNRFPRTVATRPRKLARRHLLPGSLQQRAMTRQRISRTAATRRRDLIPRPRTPQRIPRFAMTRRRMMARWQLMPRPPRRIPRTPMSRHATPFPSAAVPIRRQLTPRPRQRAMMRQRISRTVATWQRGLIPPQLKPRPLRRATARRPRIPRTPMSQQRMPFLSKVLTRPRQLTLRTTPRRLANRLRRATCGPSPPRASWSPPRRIGCRRARPTRLPGCSTRTG